MRELTYPCLVNNVVHIVKASLQLVCKILVVITYLEIPITKCATCHV